MAVAVAGTGRDRRRPEERRWPSVHRPWPLLTGEDGVVTVAISWVDIVFDSDLERRGGRFESNHLCITPQIRGPDCSICSLYIPSQPELWAGLGTVPTNPSPEVLQRHLLHGRSFPGSRAKSILHNEKRCIMGSLV